MFIRTACIRALSAPLLAVCFVCNLANAAAPATPSNAEGSAPTPQYNPNFHYFMKGQTVGSREFAVGDAANWHVPVKELSGRTPTGKVKVEQGTYKEAGDAIRVNWSNKNATGQLALYGQAVDLSSVKDKAALVFDVKVEKKPRGKVMLAMDCEWPCRGKLYIESFLKKAPLNEWLSFPVPLSCFKGETFDLSKINGVFLLSTEAAMTISLANVRVERMPADLQGCSD